MSEQYSRTYLGSIEDVLANGEYDQGDKVEIDYDELYDLVEQAKLVFKGFGGDHYIDEYTKNEIQRRTNRPLHPCLGGSSPYTGFLQQK